MTVTTTSWETLLVYTLDHAILGAYERFLRHRISYCGIYQTSHIFISSHLHIFILTGCAQVVHFQLLCTAICLFWKPLFFFGLGQKQATWAHPVSMRMCRRPKTYEQLDKSYDKIFYASEIFHMLPKLHNLVCL